MTFDAWKRRPDQASLSHLLESVEPRVERICRRILRDPHDAEEAKQEVLLEVASGLEAIVDGAHFDRWVGKVAFRTALDRQRMRLRRIARELEAAGRAPNGASRDDALHESMSRLDEDDRELLIERYFDRRTLREMGDRRGISAVAARKRLAGAQDRLKRMLGGAIPIALIVGASAVKAKTAAAMAIVALSLLLGGAWVARRSARQQPNPVTHSVPSPAPDLAMRESGVKPDPRMAEPGPSKVERRRALIENLERYAELFTTRETRRDAGYQGPEEGRDQWQREMDELNQAVMRLEDGLKKQVFDDPVAAAEFYVSRKDWSLRAAMTALLLAPLVAEIESEDSPAGPVLSVLLPLADGDKMDKANFLFFGRDLSRANRTLALAWIRLLEDEPYVIRSDAYSVLGRQARRGNLRETFSDHVALFQRLFESAEEWHMRASALSAVAGAVSADTDAWVLRQFETSAHLDDVQTRVSAMRLVAPRVVGEQHHRLLAGVRQGFDLAANGVVLHEIGFSGLVQLSLQLPVSASVDALTYAQRRVPAWKTPLMAGLDGIIRRVQAGEAADVLDELERMNKANGTWGTVAFSTFAR